jgi:hypothetical protein
MKTVSEIVVPLDCDENLYDLMSGLQTSIQSLRHLLNVASTGRRGWGFVTDKDDEYHAFDEYIRYLEAKADTIYELQCEELDAKYSATAKAKSKAGGAS